jgi:hypothetical protein
MPTIEDTLIFIGTFMGKVLKSLTNIIIKKVKEMSQPKL